VKLKIDDARKFAQHVAPHVIRPARIIWNQVIGAIFLLFAIPALIKTWEYYRAIETEPQSIGRIAFALPFGLIMAFFGISSFLRARRLSRQ
jgi:hypothetical protein